MKVLEIVVGSGPTRSTCASWGISHGSGPVPAVAGIGAPARAVYGLQDQVRFYSGSAEELSSFVPVEEYDLIYSFGVIHHTPHPERVVEQMREYTKPGTVVKLMVYYGLHGRCSDSDGLRQRPILAIERTGGEATQRHRPAVP